MRTGFMPIIYGTQAEVDAGSFNSIPGVTILVVDANGVPTGPQYTGNPSGPPTSSGDVNELRGTVSTAVFPTTGGTGDGGAPDPSDYWMFDNDITFVATSTNKINGATSGSFPGFGGDMLLNISNIAGVKNWSIISRGTGYVPAMAGANSDITSLTGLTTPLTLAQGGTGQDTAQEAMNVLAGTQIAGTYLRSDGTNTTLSTIQVADVPTLNQNTTGTASNVTGTVAVANGGTGATTLASGKILTGNGTGAVQDTLTAPAGAIVGETDTQNMTNKTLDGSNSIAGGAVVFSGAKVFNSANQSIPNSSATLVTWNSETYDTSSYHSTVSNTSRLTAPIAGYYQVSFVLTFAASSAGERVVEILVNGTTQGTHAKLFTNSGTKPSILNCNASVLLSASDYVEIRVTQDSGGSLNLNGGATTSWVDIVYLGK